MTTVPVTITGPPEAPIYHLTIPTGGRGPEGPEGPEGPAGKPGKGATSVSLLEHTTLVGGVVDWSLSFKNAITSLGTAGGEIVVPAGSYLINAPVNLKSNVHITGAGAASKLIAGSGLDKMFYSIGSLSEPVQISAPIGTGDIIVETKTNHGFTPGDSLMLRSQRNAMSSDAGEDWRLGTAGTNKNVYVYFGEFSKVRATINPKSFTLGGPLIYPGYRPDKTLETDSLARESAEIFKVSFIENASISNLSIEGGTIGEVILFVYGKNCVIDNITWNGASDSSMVKFHSSLNCEGRNLNTEYPYTTTPPEIYSRNTYLTTSSQSSGFVNCTVDNATQSFDVSPSWGGITTTNCYIKECVATNATIDGMTIHGGTYGITVQDSIFTNCNGNGIVTRSRNSRIINNTVSGSYDDTTERGRTGILIFEGYSRDTHVTGNHVTGFRVGLRVYSPVSVGADFNWIGANVKGNTFNQCNIGLYIERYSTNRFNGSTGVSISGNTFLNPFVSKIAGKAWAIIIGGYVKGVAITDNQIHGLGSVICEGGIKYESNSDDFHIDGNVIRSHGATPILIEKPNNASFISTLKASGFYGVNNVTGGAINIGDAETNITNRPVFSIIPYTDDSISLGSSIRRYKEIHTMNGIIVRATGGANWRISINADGTIKTALA